MKYDVLDKGYDSRLHQRYTVCSCQFYRELSIVQIDNLPYV